MIKVKLPFTSFPKLLQAKKTRRCLFCLASLQGARRIFVFLFLLLCISFEAHAKLFGGEAFFLENGMQVVVVPNHKAPIIKHMVWYKAGAVDDPMGKAGTAHLLEHLMFRGTKKIRDSEFNTLINTAGGDSNAFTSYDFTAYHQTLDISKLELAMFLESDRMENLKISEEAFKKERDIVFQERKQTVENNPNAVFQEEFRRRLWQDHHYSRPVIGTAEEIMGLELKDAEAFYERFYAPNNAVLVLSGDIDVETAKTLAEKYYGKVKRREVGQKYDGGLKNFVRSKMEMSLEQVSAVRFSRAYVTSFPLTSSVANASVGQNLPILAMLDEPVGFEQRFSKACSHQLSFLPQGARENLYTPYALEVLSSYLGEGETSKLYKDLVLTKKKALSVSSSYHSVSRFPGVFSFSLMPAAGVSAEELEKEFDGALLKAISEIDEAEIEKVKAKMLAGLVYLRDDPSDAGYIMGYMVSVGYLVDEVENQAEFIGAVKAQEVKAAAEELLRGSIMQTGVLKGTLR